jgi:hypothetical protein
MIEAIATAVLLGGINTLIDFGTTEYKLEARPIYLVGRILLVCYISGTIVGARARQLMIGSFSGILIGVLLSGLYHVLLPSLGLGAMVATWTLFWLAFALLEALLQDARRALVAVLLGLGAALLSGLLFWMLPRVWTESDPDQPSYLRLLVLWTSAFLPGFVVVFWQHKE